MRIRPDRCAKISSVNIRTQKKGTDNVLAMDLDLTTDRCTEDDLAEILGLTVDDIRGLWGSGGFPACKGITVDIPPHEAPHLVTVAKHEELASRVRKITAVPTGHRKCLVSFQVQVPEPNEDFILASLRGYVTQEHGFRLEPQQSGLLGVVPDDEEESAFPSAAEGV